MGVYSKEVVGLGGLIAAPVARRAVRTSATDNAGQTVWFGQGSIMVPCEAHCPHR